MALYEELQELATDLLNDDDFNQQTLSYVQMVPAVGGSPDNPLPPVKKIIPTAGVAKGVSFKFISDGFATSTDLTAIIPVIDGVTPSVNDRIIIAGKEYKIIADISAPAGLMPENRVVWKFIIRAA